MAELGQTEAVRARYVGGIDVLPEPWPRRGGCRAPKPA